MDVSYRSLEVAAERLHLDTLPPKQKERIRLIQGSLMYWDKRLPYAMFLGISQSHF